jgi:hypothetical protein
MTIPRSCELVAEENDGRTRTVPASPLALRGYHGEAKSWHALSRAIRRGLINMKILGSGPINLV